MSDGLADIDALFARAMESWRPPARLSISDWADEFFVLSPETAADPGRWHTLPYQRGILDAITDPDVTQVTWMKAARIGYTLCISAAIGYFIEHEPSSMLVVQPTVEDAKGFSKETIAPMLRDVPVLARVVFGELEERGKGPKDASATLTHKTFPGGILSLVGANSGTGFRRISRRIVMLDEVDAYPPSAGVEGDPVLLAMKRSEFFWDRKIIAGSTPLIAGASRIEEMFEAGDRRRYYVPCPHCGHMDFLRFSMRDDDELDGGHLMRWPKKPKEDPAAAHFECSECHCAIDESSKFEMLERGEWRAEREFAGHASFHLWAAYSMSPNATWGQIAAEFLATKKDPEKLKTFVNTTLGQTWKERGEAPDWERLYDRRESYAIGTVPADVIAVTSGVDVQKDRLMYEVVGWAEDKESFSIEIGILWGDTSLEVGTDEEPSVWQQLDALLDRSFPGADGQAHHIAKLAIDSGYNTQVVYNWGRRKPASRVMATKGVSGMRALVGAHSPVDVTVRGQRLQRGYHVWPVGVDLAKSELYGWLRLRRGEGDAPPGYCHFPEYGEDYFQQLTSEHLVTVINRRTHRAKMEWHQLPNRENHYLDARILARIAAAVLGIDRIPKEAPLATEPQATEPEPRTVREHEFRQPLDLSKPKWLPRRR